MTQATELTKLTDDQVEKELKDLQGKTDVTPEEKEKLSTLKEERQTRYQKRIDKLSFEKKRESEEKEKLKQELEEQKKKIKELENRSPAKPKINEEFVEIDGKKFYTDSALESMVAAEELTPQQAYAHQHQRLKAEIKDETIREIKGEDSKRTAQKEFEDDKKRVLDEYPQFSQSHPDFDPEDPLYKTATEIWAEGYQNNPRGLSLSIKRAKQILRMSDTHPDVSSEHSVGRTRSSSENRQGEKEVSLSAEERESAVRMYGGIINPVTQRHYTEAEAIVKAIKAKTARMRR